VVLEVTRFHDQKKGAAGCTAQDECRRQAGEEPAGEDVWPGDAPEDERDREINKGAGEAHHQQDADEKQRVRFALARVVALRRGDDRASQCAHLWVVGSGYQARIST